MHEAVAEASGVASGASATDTVTPDASGVIATNASPDASWAAVTGAMPDAFGAAADNATPDAPRCRRPALTLCSAMQLR
jgi:hypothetical protein